MAKVTISIVSHDQSSLVLNLLKSIDEFLFTLNHEVRILILSNLPESQLFSSEKFEIILKTNLRMAGFGANHNQNFITENSDYFIIMNPDITFFENFNLDHYIRLHGKRTISCPIQISEKHQSIDFIRRDLTILNLLKRQFTDDFCDYHDFDWMSGAFMVVDSLVYKELGGFDPKFFMYVEDCDLCSRAKKACIELKVIGSHRVIHDSQRQSKRKLKHLYWHIMSLVRYFWQKTVF